MVINDLLTVSHHRFYQHLFHSLCLFVGGMQTYRLEGVCLRGSLRVPLLFPLPFFFLLFDVLTDHAIHRVQERLLLDTHTLRQFTEICRTQDRVGNDRDALHDAADSL